MTRDDLMLLPLAVFFLCGIAAPANAATITSNLGNTASGLVDGQSTTIFDVIAAQGGQAVPFDQGYGSDPISNFSQTWAHSYAIPAGDIITSATIEIGIIDHDSASPGSQLSLFDVDGTSLTGAMDAAFEASGGMSAEYNEYSVSITASAFAALADGSAIISLDLMGPVETPNLFPPPTTVTENFNGANLIFSTLTIETRPVPEPSTFVLAIIGLSLGSLSLRRRQRSSHRLE